MKKSHGDKSDVYIKFFRLPFLWSEAYRKYINVKKNMKKIEFYKSGKVY